LFGKIFATTIRAKCSPTQTPPPSSPSTFHAVPRRASISVWSVAIDVLRGKDRASQVRQDSQGRLNLDLISIGHSLFWDLFIVNLSLIKFLRGGRRADG